MIPGSFTPEYDIVSVTDPIPVSINSILPNRSFLGRLALSAISALVCLSVACKPKPAQQRFPFHGMVINTEPRGKQALIQHDNIPGLMKGMTMPFNIKDDKTLAALRPGDTLQATLVKQQYESWLEDVKVVSHQDLDDNKPAIPQPLQHPEPGTPVPDFTFVNQNGKRLRFSQLRGVPVLLTFIYTRCPLPDYCPRMNSNLLQVARAAPDSSLQLLSISFDPDHDTPAVLRSYASHWINDLPPSLRSRWQFVAPAKSELPDVLRFFAVTANPENGLITHSLSSALVDAEGKIIRWYPANLWTPEDVLQDLRPSGRNGNGGSTN
jgi:protein SCO1/2